MERNERLVAANKCAAKYTDEKEKRIARAAFVDGCEFEAQGEIVNGVVLEYAPEGLDGAAYTIPLKLLTENKASYGLDSTGMRYPMDCFKAGAEWAFSRFEKVALSDDLYIKK